MDGLNGFMKGVALLTAVLAVRAAAGPPAGLVVLGPVEVGQLRQHTEFSSDWSMSDRFELGRPISLVVVTERLLLPGEGEAELLFSLPGGDSRLPGPAPVSGIYHATLQLGGEVRRLGLDAATLRRGEKLRLRGWPATDANRSPARLLVEELELLGSGRLFRLHDYPAMQAREPAPE
jgi:hypothetical protein